MTWNGLFFHSPSSFLMEFVICMHDYVMMFVVSIMLLVFFLIMNVLWSDKFNLSFQENHQLETVWTLLPFVLLIFMIVPSLFSLYMLDSCLFCGLTYSITGHQWYWSYSLKSFGYKFDSYILPGCDSMIRLLEVDNHLLIPTSTPIRFLLSSEDVIHSWTVPSFGVKMDAVPGRLNQFCLTSKRSGLYFGQCSEICGANHSFMPIVVESVKFNEFIFPSA